MSSSIFFATAGGNDLAVLGMTFTNAAGVDTDPTTVTCTITDPTGATTVHTFNGAAPNDITKVSTGVYSLSVPCTIVGLWGFEWDGVGAAQDTDAGTWTVNPAATINQFYTSVEELKDRLGVTTSASDLSCQKAVQAAARAIEGHCGRHFYQVQEARTFVPYEIWDLPIDDLVSLTSCKVDMDGDGIYETTFTLNTDFQLATGIWEFNQLASGELRPFTQARIINGAGGGKFWPFIWPFAPLNRVQITGTWGWPEVPFGVQQATLQVAAEFFKLKDAPFGIAGTSEFGYMRIPKQNPYITRLLSPYISSRRKVGV